MKTKEHPCEGHCEARITYGRTHMDSSVVSTEETVAGNIDRCSEFFIEGKLLVVGPLTSHLIFFNFGFFTFNRRTLSTPGDFWRNLTEEALYRKVAMKIRNSMREHMQSVALHSVPDITRVQ